MSSSFFTENALRVSNTSQGECSIVRILLSGITAAYTSKTGEPDIHRISGEVAIRLNQLNAGDIELEVKKSAMIHKGKVVQAVQFKSFVKVMDANVENYFISISEQLAKMFCQPNVGKAQLTFDHKLYTQEVTWR